MFIYNIVLCMIKSIIEIFVWLYTKKFYHTMYKGKKYRYQAVKQKEQSKLKRQQKRL